MRDCAAVGTALPPAPPIALSVVVPFYRKLRELESVLPFNARYLGRPDVELVLVLDEPASEAGVVALVSRFPLLSVRIIVNDLDHAWRSPAIAINVGIRAALGEHVLVMSPESAFVGDVPTRVLDSLRRLGSEDAVAGRVAWATFAEAAGVAVERLFDLRARDPSRMLHAAAFYGSVAARRSLLMAIGGYDETLSGWGGEDDNLRARIAMRGGLIALDAGIALLHLSDEPRGPEHPTAPRNDDATRRQSAAPAAPIANDDGWGTGFDRVSYDWASRERQPDRRITAGRTRRGMRSEGGVLALFSFRYDASLVPDLLANLDPIVDGWVAFDDRDADGPFSDEPARRRLLIRAARALGGQWALAIDPDERLETALAERIGDLTARGGARQWAFDFRELYTPDQFRVDGVWGHKTQAKLFPLRGDLQSDPRPLHGRWCANFPIHASDANLYHLRMIAPARRAVRAALYRRLDPESRWQPEGYDYLADEAGLRLESIAAARGYQPPHHDDGEIWSADPAKLDRGR